MRTALTSLSYLIFSAQVLAFNNDLSINHPNFNTENFLDINSVQFSETLNDQWDLSDNGWRITSHSLSSDLLYTDSEIKFMTQLSDSVKIKLNFEQAVFYSEQEVSDPILEVDVRPSSKYEISASLIGTPKYAKSDSELGFAITAGHTKSDYIRYTEIFIDYYYNQKTRDNSAYLQYQQLKKIEAAYRWSYSLDTKFSYREFSPMDLLYDDQITHFKHQAYGYDAVIKYKFNPQYHYKFSITGFSIDKSITGTTDQSQQTDYDSIDLKLLTHQQRPYQFSFGYRYDVFTNEIIDSTDASLILDYSFSTQQIYSTLYHAYTAQKAWEVGLYIGLSKEPNEFINLEQDNSRVIESQLKTSWAYHSASRKSSIFLHMSWNLDSTVSDPGDGAGITYQSTF